MILIAYINLLGTIIKNKKMKLFRTLLTNLLSLTSVLVISQTITLKPIKVPVSIDSRVELIGILCYLSDFQEYSNDEVISYKTAVDEYFKDFRNHEAVNYLKEIRNNLGIGYNAPMEFAVYLTDSLTPLVPFSQVHNGFDSRWNEESYNKFSILVKKFANDTKFDDFFKTQKKKYEQDILAIEQNINSSINFDWFSSYFGEIPKNTKFKIILSLNSGRSNYGATTIINNESIKYSINGVYERQGGINLGSFSVGLIIHEFCHSFCNPIISEYETKLEKTGKLIYDDFISHKHQKEYGCWETVLCETFVRTSVSCYLKENGTCLKSSLNRMVDKKKGFMWIKPLTKSFLKLNKTSTISQSKDLYMTEFNQLPRSRAGEV